LPWYERAAFQRLWELSHDRDDAPGDYDLWRRSALKVIDTWLGRGRTLHIITVKPEEFFAWLEARNLQNTAETRLTFVEEKAKNAGSQTDRSGSAFDPQALQRVDA